MFSFPMEKKPYNPQPYICMYICIYMKSNYMLTLDPQLINKLKEKRIKISPLVNTLLSKYIADLELTEEDNYIKQWEEASKQEKNRINKLQILESKLKFQDKLLQLAINNNNQEKIEEIKINIEAIEKEYNEIGGKIDRREDTKATKPTS